MQLMDCFKVKLTPAICQIFFDSLSKMTSVNDTNTENINPYSVLKQTDNAREHQRFLKHVSISLDYKNRKTKLVRSKFRKRTFRDYRNRFNWLIQDVVTFTVCKNCEQCNMANPSDNKREDNDHCFFCGLKLKLEIKVAIGLKQAPTLDSCIDIPIELQSVQQLRAQVNELYNDCMTKNATNTMAEGEIDVKDKFDLMILRETKADIFWHCIFYFIENQIPYDFILPYEDNDKLLQYKEVNKHIEASSDNPLEFDDFE